MLFDHNQDLEQQPRRTKTLAISLLIHALLIGVVVVRPDLFSSQPKRIIRIAGQDFDLSKLDAQELTLQPPPNQARPPQTAQNEPPLVQPQPEPPPPQAAPPPPPPPPPPPQPPPATISPDDIIAEGARPDGQNRPSQGNTREQARAGGVPQAAPPLAPPPEPRGDEGRDQIAENTNPNALRLPNLANRAGRIVDDAIEQARRAQIIGPRTGIDRPGPEDPNFSTEEPTILSDTRGYDFGPYMNQVVNRVRVNWYSLIPEIARLGKRGRAVIIFTILQSGTVTDIRLVANSGTDPLDRAALGSITASNPFQQLPPNFDGDHLVLQFTFLYNMR